MNQNTTTADKLITIVDGFSVSLSGFCLIHCLFGPLLVIFLPMVGTSMFTHELFHQLLLVLVVPASIFALGMGCHKHRSWTVAALGILGVSLLAFAAFFGHDMLGETGEEALTILGGLILATGHLKNYSQCRHDCHQPDGHHHHHDES